jgi:hypothetical protein
MQRRINAHRQCIRLRKYEALMMFFAIICMQSVARVIGVSKLKTKFKQYEAKRVLCSSYDLFLADDRLVGIFFVILYVCMCEVCVYV